MDWKTAVVWVVFGLPVALGMWAVMLRLVWDAVN